MNEYKVLVNVVGRLLPLGTTVVAFNRELAVVEAVVLMTVAGKLVPGSLVTGVETKLMRRV